MEFTGLLQELNQGRHLAQQLRQHLHPPPPSSSSSSYDGILLIDRILRSYENALSVLAGGRHDEIPAVAPMNAAAKEGYVFKKRKVMEKWSEKVKVPSGSGSSIEPPLNDGFSWRKYGQKDILGSKYPRSYFRCSHRFAQGCLATKQVQRSDNDSTMYEIAYKGMHTCKKALHLNTTPKEEQTSLLQHSMPLKQGQKLLKQQLDPLCLTFTSDTICVKSEKLDNVDDCLLRPFCTPSPWIRPEVQDDQSELSPTFESNDMFGFDCVGDQDWDLETRFVSVPNSFTNISMGDLEECCSFDNLVELFS